MLCQQNLEVSKMARRPVWFVLQVRGGKHTCKEWYIHICNSWINFKYLMRDDPMVDPGIHKPGDVVQARYNFWGFEIVLMPLHTYTMLLLWEYRMIYTFWTLRVDYNKVYACLAVKLFKNKPLRNFKQVRWRCIYPQCDY